MIHSLPCISSYSRRIDNEDKQRLHVTVPEFPRYDFDSPPLTAAYVKGNGRALENMLRYIAWGCHRDLFSVIQRDRSDSVAFRPLLALSIRGLGGIPSVASAWEG
jgi:hypothetical protein